MNIWVRSAGCLLALVIAAGHASGQVVLFSEDFEGGGAAANFTLVSDPDDVSSSPGNGGDDSFDAAFSYTDLGIVGDVRSGTGAQLQTENALTAFISGVAIDGSKPISIKYDLYADPESGGSTEYAFVGVGNGSLPFENYLRGSLQGTEETQGVFAGGLTDSDTLGASDYIILEGDGSIGEPTELFNADAAAVDQDGTPFNQILPGGTPGPSGESTTPAVLQHQWVEVELRIIDDEALYFLAGNRIARVTASGTITGSVGLGIGDPFPSTNQDRFFPISDPTNIIIDNIVITQLPEPTSVVLILAGLLGAVGTGRRVR